MVRLMGLRPAEAAAATAATAGAAQRWLGSSCDLQHVPRNENAALCAIFIRKRTEVNLTLSFALSKTCFWKVLSMVIHMHIYIYTLVPTFVFLYVYIHTRIDIR